MSVVHQDISNEIALLRAENAKLLAKLQAKREAKVHLKTSAKGALSVYGLGRFPVTLYSSQWQTLLGITDEIKAYLVEHKDELSQGKAEE